MRASIVATLAVLALAPSGVETATTSPPPSIDIARIGLHASISDATLDTGPMWWPARGRPGCGCTIAIAGHRTTHTHPFLRINTLRAGDRIVLHWRGRAYAYRVTGSRMFPSTALHIADDVGHERLLLSSCTPPGSAAFRYVVYAQSDV